MDAVSEVKERLNIEDVIGEYVQLKRAGRNFKGMSPFSNEKTASFMVSPEKQIWHDFSSGKGGNVFSFIMEVEGLEFKAALELLARKAGVDLEQFRGKTQGNGYNAQLKNRVLEALELAVRFYQKQLTGSKEALTYLLKERQFTKKTVLDWQIGYAPNNGRALSDFLTKHGFTTDEMKRAGLVVERRHGLGDMFRGRIMIPLADQQGAVVGFTARILIDEPDAPKYINTPQTIVYDKGRQVFGLHMAKERIRKDGFAVVVEGNMDVIASHQAEVMNVVATAGTAMTESHLKTLKRFTGDIRLSFDSDQAGLNATERVIPMAQKAEVQLSIIQLSDAKDPDELIRREPQAWAKAVNDRKYAMDWLIERYVAIYDLKSASGKREFTDVILATVRRLSDSVEQEHYLKKVAEITDTSIEAVVMKLAKKPALSDTPRMRTVKPQPAAATKTEQEQQIAQDHFLSIALAKKSMRQLLPSMDLLWFRDGPSRELAQFLQKNPAFNGSGTASEKLQSIADYVKIVGLQYEELYASIDDDQLREIHARLKKRIIEIYVKKQRKLLAVAMQQSVNDNDNQKLVEKVQRLNQLK